MGKKNVYILLTILVIGIGLLVYFLWPRVGEEDRGEPVISGPPKLEIYMGAIEMVGKNSLTLKTAKADVMPLLGEQQEFDFVDFKISEQAKFYRYTDEVKSKEDFYKEQEEFNKKMAKLKERGKSAIGIEAGIEAPSWYIIEEIIKNELAKGQSVTIYSYQQKGSNMASKIIVEREKRGVRFRLIHQF